MSHSIEYLLEKLSEIESYRDPNIPPPSGVSCDCVTDPELAPGHHFHVRVMQATCDGCGDEFKTFFHAYSKSEGYNLLVMEARSLGWSVDENANYYLCPKCLKKENERY